MGRNQKRRDKSQQKGEEISQAAKFRNPYEIVLFFAFVVLPFGSTALSSN